MHVLERRYATVSLDPEDLADLEKGHVDLADLENGHTALLVGASSMVLSAAEPSLLMSEGV